MLFVSIEESAKVNGDVDFPVHLLKLKSLEDLWLEILALRDLGDIIPPDEILKEGKDCHVGFCTYKLRHIKFSGC